MAPRITTNRYTARFKESVAGENKRIGAKPAKIRPRYERDGLFSRTLIYEIKHEVRNTVAIAVTGEKNSTNVLPAITVINITLAPKTKNISP